MAAVKKDTEIENLKNSEENPEVVDKDEGDSDEEQEVGAPEATKKKKKKKKKAKKPGKWQCFDLLRAHRMS